MSKQVIHVGQFSIEMKKIEPTNNRVNDMMLQSKRVGEFVRQLNDRIADESFGGPAHPSVTWREVNGYDNLIRGELYVYAEGVPQNGAAAALQAVYNICGLAGHFVKFEQHHKF